MFGVAPYGCISFGGLLKTEETMFPLTLILSESEIYNLVSSESEIYNLTLSEA
jgi:hypothetical protein